MDKRKKGKNYTLITTLYLTVAFALFFAVMLFTGYETEYIDNPTQLENFDFSSRLVSLSPALFEKYPEALYSPEDFLNERATPSFSTRNYQFVTYRLVLPLQEGEVYGISGHSATHAMTLWVDGVMLYSVGVPGNSLETMTTGVSYFAAYFTARSVPTEIIIQRSSFVHADGGQLNTVYLGAQSLIAGTK